MYEITQTQDSPQIPQQTSEQSTQIPSTDQSSPSQDAPVKNCTNMYTNPDYQHFVVEYRGNILEQVSKYEYLCAAILNRQYAIIAIKPSDLARARKDIPAIVSINFRTMHVLQQISYLDASNISNIKINP